MLDTIRVLMITSEWPSPEKPHEVPFIVRQVNALRTAGIDITLFPFRGRKKLSNYWNAWRAVQAKIQSGTFDLVHAQWGQSGLLALPKQIPLVVTFRGDDVEGIIGANGSPTLMGKILQIASRQVARQADQIIVVSEHLAHSISGRSFHVIPSGLDLELFCPSDKKQARNKLGLPNDRRFVLFAGAAANPRKRYALAENAVSLLQKDLNVELLVASGITPNQVPVYMNASDVLLLTSLHEGSPNVVKEALAVNLPVVSTNVGDVRARLGNLPGCRVVDNDAPESIAAALKEVLAYPFPVNSRETVMDLDEKLLSQKVISVYKKAISKL